MAAKKTETADLAPLAARIGHAFANPDLLDEALTHPSVLVRSRSGARRHYDRLEFLGDRVLGLIVADALIQRYPSADAGELARRYNAVVRQPTLAEAAAVLDLGNYLRLSRSERETGGTAKPAILADAFEAVTAALFVDAGLEAARVFVLRELDAALADAGAAAKDAKTGLQEFAAARGWPPPHYTVTAQDGPAHLPRFQVSVALDRRGAATGEGPSKRAAEQVAAQTLLDRLKGEPS